VIQLPFYFYNRGDRTNLHLRSEDFSFGKVETLVHRTAPGLNITAGTPVNMFRYGTIAPITISERARGDFNLAIGGNGNTGYVATADSTDRIIFRFEAPAYYVFDNYINNMSLAQLAVRWNENSYTTRHPLWANRSRTDGVQVNWPGYPGAAASEVMVGMFGYYDSMFTGVNQQKSVYRVADGGKTLYFELFLDYAYGTRSYGLADHIELKFITLIADDRAQNGPVNINAKWRKNLREAGASEQWNVRAMTNIESWFFYGGMRNPATGAPIWTATAAEYAHDTVIRQLLATGIEWANEAAFAAYLDSATNSLARPLTSNYVGAGSATNRPIISGGNTVNDFYRWDLGGNDIPAAARGANIGNLLVANRVNNEVHFERVGEPAQLRSGFTTKRN